MTKVEARYEFKRPFEESWLEAIEKLHGVYGLQGVKLGPELRHLTVLYDASRLKLADVERELRTAGLPVERVQN